MITLWLFLCAPSLDHALAARAQGELSAAQAELEALLEESSDSADLWTELGVTRAWQSDYDGALNALDQALMRAPHHRGATLMRGRVLAWAGQRSSARRVFENALERTANDTAALNGLAFVHRTELNASRAKSLYLRVLELEAENQEARDGLNALRDLTRSRLSAELDTQFLEQSERQTALRVDGSYQLDPEWSLRGEYQTNAPSDAFNDAGADHVLGAHLQYGHQAQWSVQVGSSVRLGEQRLGFVHAGGAWNWLESNTLEAGTRIRTDGEETLSFVGSTQKLVGSLTLGGQLFYSTGALRQATAVAALGHAIGNWADHRLY
ncbi:MAG: tetratricopeptide repeat protein, partial [Myxococcota bacterium]